MTNNRQRLQSLAKIIGRLGADYRMARRTRKEEKRALELARVRVVDCTEAQRITQLVAQTVQQQAHESISSVVSRCLSAVFDESYRFKIVFEQKRGRTEARLVFLDGDNEIDPMTAAGGGVVDVASFALRLSAMLLSRPPLRRIMILDEPFKFVSEEYRSRIRQLIEELSRELEVKFIFVTHIRELEIGKVIQL